MEAPLSTLCWLAISMADAQWVALTAERHWQNSVAPYLSLSIGKTFFRGVGEKIQSEQIFRLYFDFRESMITRPTCVQ